LRVVAKEGQQIQTGDLVIVLEAMKMETEVRASRAGNVASVPVSEGDSVQAGDALIYLA
jgi:oxaloacetate decarboxylase alpha subunit